MRLRLLPFDHAVRNLARSPRRLALVLASSALVSFLALASVAFSRGMTRSFGSTGLATNAMLLGVGSEESAERSEIAPTVADELAASVDGLATYAGVAAVSPQIHVALPVAPARDAETDAPPPTDLDAVPVPCRGFTPAALLVHPQVRLAIGRWPAPGADEIAVGAGALSSGVPDLGARLLVGGEPFTVVGILDASGTAMHGEIWMRLERLGSLTRRSTHSCVVAALGDAEFDDVDVFAATRLDLELLLLRESDYYASIAGLLAPLRVLAAITSALIASGGILAGINALHAAFAARAREAATLQAIGFARRAIAVSLLVESTTACAAGALVGCALGGLLLDGLDVRLSMGAFGLEVDAAANAAGLGSGLLLGCLGALPGIWRCLSLPIPEALRA